LLSIVSDLLVPTRRFGTQVFTHDILQRFYNGVTVCLW